MKRMIGLTIAVLCATVQLTEAATISVTTTGGNDLQLTSLTVDGESYTSWINITVDDISSGAYFQIPDGATQPAAADRMDLLEDNLLGTSIAALSKLDVTFDSAVVNRSGVDIVLFDLGTGDNDVEVKIGETTQTYAATHFNSVVSSFSSDQYSANASMPSKTAWLDSATTFNYLQDHSQGIAALGIDLDDFGVATGASITTMAITNNGSVDPAMVIGLVPEPSTWLALLTGAFALAMWRWLRN